MDGPLEQGHVATSIDLQSAFQHMCMFLQVYVQCQPPISQTLHRRLGWTHAKTPGIQPEPAAGKRQLQHSDPGLILGQPRASLNR